MDSHLPPLDEQTVQRMLWKFAMCSSEHAVLLLDAAGNIVWANTGAAKILGADRDSLPGTSFALFFTREDVETGIPEHELEVAMQSGTASDDRWMARIDRSRFWASGVSVYLGSQTASCAFLKIFRDLTEFKMQLETARERGREADMKSENMGAAIALLAHELRNPLAGIGLGLDLLERQVPADPGISRRLATISGNLKHAAVLVDDVMEHSKVTSKGYKLDPSPCTLRELLEVSASIALHQTAQTGRNVSVLVPAGDIEMHIDRMRMQQVFVNLVANALRYTKPPGRIWVTGTIEGQEVIVRVSDEG
ncbi:MAG: PAS domain-containing sensor histidine kinase, partial [Pseudoxanthomonas sp.]